MEYYIEDRKGNKQEISQEMYKRLLNRMIDIQYDKNIDKEKLKGAD